MVQDLPIVGPLESALRSSIEHAPWLSPSDSGAVELAAAYARRIDQGTREFLSGEIESSEFNKVLYLGPHLLNTLKSIGLAPEERQKILSMATAKAEVDPVDELKQRRLRALNKKTVG